MNVVEALQMLVHTLVHMFDGTPAAVQVLNWIVLAVIAFSWVSLPVLLFQGRGQTRRVRRHRDKARDRGVPSGQDQFLWVFVVPALNEEVTIADAVARLQSTCASHAVFLVVDDGSDDATAEILAGIQDPRLQVLTRVAPSARRGKARALDHAWRHLREQVLRRPEYSCWDEDHVIMTVVDADGRLDPHAPDLVADHFSRPEIGGVQALVRIYNRRSWLTWGQDVEFSTFGRVFQLGRSGWGSANMGGNGQFNRLSALTSLVDEDGPDIEMLPPATAQVPTADEGPWRDRLTEDQDLGVRLVQSGWRSVQDNDTWVDQQGVNSLRRLYRQRTRWVQGNWQAFSLLPTVWQKHLPVPARIDAIHYLLGPLLQLLTGICFATAVVLVIADALRGDPVTIGAWWLVVIFLGLSFGPGTWSLSVQGGHWYSPAVALVLVLPYSLYTWLIFPVTVWALVRLALGRNAWAKTGRESLEPIQVTTAA